MNALNKLAYRKLYLYPDYRIINSTHLFYNGTIPYMGHRFYMNKLKERILQSDGGAFLITGFRGVGKSTLIHNTISELNKETHKFNFAEAMIIMSSEKDYSEILFEIIRRIYEKLSQDNIWKSLSVTTKDRIKLAYARTLFCIKHNENYGIEQETSVSVANIINSAFKGKTTSQIAEETTYLAFSEKDIEYELVQIIDTMQQENIAIKFVIIFDEIDKLTCNESGKKCFELLLNRIKNLISAINAIFIFVAGIDVYEKWEKDSKRINSLYNSLFGWHLYLPCIWDSIEELFYTIQNKKYVYEPIDSKFENIVENNYKAILQRPFQCIRDYILFKGKGIPRKIITVFNDFVSWDENGPYFQLTSKLTKGIVQISRLCEKFYNYIDKNKFRTVIDKDINCSIFLSMLDYLFFKLEHTFTKEEITSVLLYENELFILNFEQIVYNLLKVFEDERIIVKIEDNKYKVIDASILQRDQSLSILDVNLLFEKSESSVSSELINEPQTVNSRFQEQIKSLNYTDVINFWKPFKAMEVIAESGELMSFLVENIKNKSKYFAILYTPKNREKIRKLGNLYMVGTYQFCNRYLIDTTDILKEGAPVTSLRTAIEGYSLAHLISAKVHLKYVYLIIKQVLDFLNALHKKEFFNVRLKPDNLLICRNGCLKILDLQHVCPKNTELSPYPTRLYSAPEIYTSTHDFLSDYYSVGILLVELILGKNLSTICLERHIDVMNYLVELNCSKKLLKVIQKATSFDISERFLTSNEFLAALDKCPEFRFYRYLPLPKSNEGTVKNHAVTLLPMEHESGMSQMLNNSMNPISNGMKETVILDYGYFENTDMMEKENANLRPSNAYLLRIKTNEIVNIDKTIFVIGKDKKSVAYYMQDMSISRKHASIIIHNGKYCIVDHHSTNGTYLNQLQLTPEVKFELHDKDKICLADEIFVFHIIEKNDIMNA
mgnify:CR=1 FL=1